MKYLNKLFIIAGIFMLVSACDNTDFDIQQDHVRVVVLQEPGNGGRYPGDGLEWDIDNGSQTPDRLENLAAMIDDHHCDGDDQKQRETRYWRYLVRSHRAALPLSDRLCHSLLRGRNPRKVSLNSRTGFTMATAL